MPLNILAWNNGDRTLVLFCWFLRTEVMINRDSWGYSYSIVRGEILGFTGRRTTAKAFTKDVFINQERKLGDRR